MNQNELTEMVSSGLSIAQISEKTNKSKGSIRFWLDKFNLKTAGRAGSPKFTPAPSGFKNCTDCKQCKPVSEFSIRKDRPGKPFSKCKKCIAKDAYNKSKRIRKTLVQSMGGTCSRCNGKFHYSQYEFHHVEPEHKDFTISNRKFAALGTILKELEKCVLVCSNCHTTIHKELKEKSGYQNKISGNSERWNENKSMKLEYTKTNHCEKCGYDEYQGALCIIFKPEHKHYYKYNKTHWDKDYMEALKQATVLCRNCDNLAEDQNH